MSGYPRPARDAAARRLKAIAARARGEGAMPDGALGPIDGPVAWRGGELAAESSWRRCLTDGEVAALERAAAAAEARGVAATGFAAAEFPVPELAPLFG